MQKDKIEIDKDFYITFEDRFRGSREQIKNRLEFYLPFILPLNEEFPEIPFLDIGCGRGEWIELLDNKHIKANGIDVDERMVDYCQNAGLQASKCDALGFLDQANDESFAVISAFHVVEHIPFPDLVALVDEARRTLIPGGLLILETPNTENIEVGTSKFYLDPTHINPLPSALLAFIPERSGFEVVKTIRLQEEKYTEQKARPTLKSVISGVSQDYSVIALKNGKTQSSSTILKLFDKDYGTSLYSITKQYDDNLHKIISNLEHMCHESYSKVSLTEKNLLAIQKALDSQNNRLSKIENDTELVVGQLSKEREQEYRKFNMEKQKLESEVEMLDEQLNMVLNSLGWRVFSPIRKISEALKALRGLLK